MPSLESVQFYVRVGILVFTALLTIAFHLQARAVEHEQDRPTPPPDELDVPPESSVNQQTAWNPSLALVPPLLIIIVGRWFTRMTYYDYFISTVLLWPLAASCIIAIFVGVLTSGALIKMVAGQGAQALFQLMLLACTVAVGWAITSLVPQKLNDDIWALYSGPQPASGQVEAKNSTGGRDPIAGIVVDGIGYSTYDFSWLTTLQRDQTIQFVHDPAHTMAFESTHVALTPAGAVVSGSIAALWLWVGGFIVWRFQHSIARLIVVARE
jgi:hypothetical protein